MVFFLLSLVVFYPSAFYLGFYDAPPTGDITAHQIQPPVSSFTAAAGIPATQSGTLLVDAGHTNEFRREEITAFLSIISKRGYNIELLGAFSTLGIAGTLTESTRLEVLQEKLRAADSFLVILPSTRYSAEEVGEIRRFVLEKGGRLMLAADPTRDHQINSLADAFGITFRPDYLYNLVEYDLNFQDIFIKDFNPDQITSGLGQISFYTAGSVESAGPGLAISDANTKSTVVNSIEPLYPMVKSQDGGVVAVGDLTFMVPPQNAIYDNALLLSNLADFLTKGQRQFHLTDFPHFFKDDVDIIISGSGLVDAGAQMQGVLEDRAVEAAIKGVEDLDRDSVYLGLYEDSANVAQYLQLAGVQIDSAIRTPFAPDMAPEGTAVAILHRSAERQVLIILGDTPDSLTGVLDRLDAGTIRDGLLGDFVGVYKTS